MSVLMLFWELIDKEDTVILPDLTISASMIILIGYILMESAQEETCECCLAVVDWNAEVSVYAVN